MKLKKLKSFSFKIRKNASPKEIKKKSFIYDTAEVLVIAFLLSILVRHFIVQAYYIPSKSMENTLLVNDMLLANKFIYKFRKPHRQEIIVFKNIDEKSLKDGKEFLAKRIVGLPGDKLFIKNGYLYVNNKKLNEPYIKEKCNLDLILYDRNIKNEKTGKMIFQKLDTNEITIPENHYFVMGDNRNNSLDSRFFGPVPYSKIIAKPLFIYWPPDRIGFIH